MKKTMITLMFILLSSILFSCTDTQDYTNPNTDYCQLYNEDGLFVCEKVLVGYFDTNMSLKLYYHSTDTYHVEEVFTYFEETITTYDKYLDKYTEYSNLVNIYTLNNESSTSYTVDKVLFDAIKYALDNDDTIQKNGTSLFNIALHPVLEIWHHARNSSTCEELELGISYCSVPNDEIDGIDFNTNPDDIFLDETNLTIEFLKPNMGLDLGGFAKGYVADILFEYLASKNITFLLNVGNSNVVTNNMNPTRESGLYIIALEKPVTDFALTTQYYQYIKIPSGYSVVTSGVNQRFFKDIETNDVYHHVIDPTTNYPGGEVSSITIITQGGANADILSTSLFLLDLESAKNYVNSTDNLEAVWYLPDDTIVYSENFDQYIYEIN